MAIRSVRSMCTDPPPNDYIVAADFYDLFYNFWDDIGFYLALAKKTGGPVLDAMCGTGRIALPIARAGYEVVGVELSPEMLRVAEAKLGSEKPRVRARVKLLKGDVRCDDLDGPFSLAVMAWNSLTELTSPRAQQEAILNIARHLKAGGLLAFHTDNPSDVRPTPELFKGVGTTEDGTKVVLHTTTVKTGRNRYELRFRYELSKRGKKAREIRTKVPLLFPTRKQVERMIEKAGLRVTNIYGDYDLREFTPRCKYMIFVAEKPRRSRTSR